LEETVQSPCDTASQNRNISEPEIARRRDNPIYEHFFKMLDVGVPEQAVRLKMQLQGLDDSVLDDCN
jgi:hypothetical protein